MKTLKEINNVFKDIPDPDETQLINDHRSYISSLTNKGKILSDETKKAISEATKGRASPNKGKTGVKRSEETKEAMKKAAENRPERSEETKEAHRQYALNRPKYACTVCGLMVTANLLERWHNENCKEAGRVSPTPAWLICKVCGVTETRSKIKRWHNENCKQQPI